MRSLPVTLTSALALGLALLASSSAPAQETIRVGFLGPLTGIFAQAGKDMLDGLKLSFEQSSCQLRATCSTKQREMDPALVKRLGLFDYLRARLAVAGTPDDCLAQVRAARAEVLTAAYAEHPERWRGRADWLPAEPAQSPP